MEKETVWFRCSASCGSVKRQCLWVPQTHTWPFPCQNRGSGTQVSARPRPPSSLFVLRARLVGAQWTGCWEAHPWTEGSWGSLGAPGVGGSLVPGPLMGRPPPSVWSLPRSLTFRPGTLRTRTLPLRLPDPPPHLLVLCKQAQWPSGPCRLWALGWGLWDGVGTLGGDCGEESGELEV